MALNIIEVTTISQTPTGDKERRPSANADNYHQVKSENVFEFLCTGAEASKARAAGAF